jgi:ABC-type polysaccharide/polyol phosphate transport system ATPase subunit
VAVGVAPDTPPVVAVENVSKTFQMPHERVHTLKERALHPLRRSASDRFQALQDVSFDVRRGEFFGIVGRNGSGKSTLLKCLAGIYGVDSGTIKMDGRLSTFIELGVGFNPDLAARDNALINGIMLGLTPREARERFERIIEFAELEEFVDLKLKNYSSGMQVRLAFSVMIQVDADVLLVDEVLAVGDAAFQQKCFDVFNRLKDLGKTILFVTHDMGSVERFCDRAMLLERGQMRLIGEPSRVGHHYMEMNFGRDHSAQGTAEAVEQERFGDQRAEIVDAWFEDDQGERTEALPQGDMITFRARVRFNEPIEDPAVSVLIENEQHLPLFASSSQFLDRDSTGYRAGDELLFTVRLENVFQPGRLFASPWIVSRGADDDLIDRRPRMVSAVSTGVRDTGGLVQLAHEVTLDRVGAPIEEQAAN